MHSHLDEYVTNSFSASDRRLLITKWVGEAWTKMSERKDMIQRAFKKCGISTSVDGLEDDCIKIRGLEGYVVRDVASDSSEEELFQLDSEED